MYKQEKRSLIALEQDKLTLPSVIFFNFENGNQSYGRAGLEGYLQGSEGRLMRSLKSVLGSSLMHEQTKIKHKSVPFADIIGMFIGHLKTKAEQQTNQEIEHIVLGRPVYFVDNDEKSDADAQNQLALIARAQGFKHIEFQYEPIAAALDYEQDITGEEIALIIDMGGGTSDFSVIKLSPNGRSKTNRSDDLLANSGIHIGGTDFDKALNLQEVMPHLGYQSPLKQKNLLTPNHIFQDLATWHKINLLYTQDTLRLLKELRTASQSPELIERLIEVITERKGHDISVSVEAAKIALSNMPDDNQDDYILSLGYIEKALSANISSEKFSQAIIEDIEKIEKTIKQTISESGLMFNQVQTLFLTGGSTLIPLVRQKITQLFPEANIICGDSFGSVGMGLAVDAKRKFS